MTASLSSAGIVSCVRVAPSRSRPSRSSRPGVDFERRRVGWRNAREVRGKNAGETRAAEMMGVPLYPDDLLEACAPWGNVCVVAGTHYIPIALPSILGTLFLLLPLVAVAAKLRASDQEVTRAQLRIEQLETELRVLKERL
ncbi:predicted protein [Micromonas commoda]|uniref:Uncharacterized protein n=1 Tax=Micromonas commoda (strain RCC299 / NOUM17 / CCMP2709) TaxID=296587 RepID=C1E988_MICCC|nr:predicted protein [Micromonas commoda]ACO64292.1 predicted protein [Micromonas commoda]|eukprot:XP_002503034.1 predicted protein [Micromonas commoda]